MRRSATGAGANRPRRPPAKKIKRASSTKAKRASPKNVHRTPPTKAKQTASKKVKRTSPKTITRTSPKKTRRASVATIQAQVSALQAEIREAQARENAIAEVLGVINSSPGELTPVFDAMLERAMRLCGADFGALCVFGGAGFRVTATRGFPPALNDFLQGELPVHPGGIPDRLQRGERVIHIPDLTAMQGAARTPVFDAMIDRGGARSTVWVDLRKDDLAVGYFAIYRQEVRPFTDKQIALLQNFAAQAVIAMENARLITETREALEQQTATAEVLQIINSSPGDLAPVFQAILERAHSLCGAVQGILATYDGERFCAVASHGMPDAFYELLRHPFPPVPGSPQARLLQGEPLVHFPDLAAREATHPAGAARVRAMIAAGIRTLLMVPLRKDGALLGYITALRPEVCPFADKQIALLQNFAAQAVIAMENARLLTETREALDQQTATAEVLGVINSSPGDLAPVFDAMLAKATRLCDAAFGIMSTYDGGRFHMVAVHNVPVPYVEYMSHDPPQPSPESALGRIRSGERVVHIDDYAEELANSPSDARRRALAELGGARSFVAAGMFKDDKLLGTIAAYRQEARPFTDKQIALLQNFAAQAVIAMESARLLSELRQRTEEVAELNRGLEARVAEQVEELGRVGRLKRFLAPQLAELIVSQGDEKILESHRREIVVVFCDLRGYTAFSEAAEPEEVLEFLREYHGALGPLVGQFEGTLDQFSGDGIMVFFNDPIPIPDPAERAVNMAVAMRAAAAKLIADWRERGRELGFGAGIAQGYATLGQIGFSDRSGYTAIGTVCNVAARLCAEAKDGQILLSQRINVALKGSVATEQMGALTLRGLTQPVVAYNVPLAANQPALRVIEGGPQSS